jgi:hypothetical protein
MAEAVRAPAYSKPETLQCCQKKKKKKDCLIYNLLIMVVSKYYVLTVSQVPDRDGPVCQFNSC